jgi:hypothetical protein
MKEFEPYKIIPPGMFETEAGSRRSAHAKIGLSPDYHDSSFFLFRLRLPAFAMKIVFRLI